MVHTSILYKESVLFYRYLLWHRHSATELTESSPSLPNTDRVLPNDAKLHFAKIACVKEVEREREKSIFFSIVFSSAFFHMENNEVIANIANALGGKMELELD